MNKAQLLALGRDLAAEFCEANRLSLPAVDEQPGASWRFRGTCAYYRRDVITICPSVCAPPGTGGRQWSWPGYVVDRTPYGVIQHELGHHVDYTLSDDKGAYGGDFSVKLRRLTGEDRITSYCPNTWEWFAEIFRLYVTNSDLLRALRPRTHEQLRAIYRPVIDVPWRQVLKDAPERTQRAAENKIAAVAARGA